MQVYPFVDQILGHVDLVQLAAPTMQLRAMMVHQTSIWNYALVVPVAPLPAAITMTFPDRGGR